MVVVARAVLETSGCQGRKFLRGRPPRVMHIHEYSNVIERRRGERERKKETTRVLECFDQPSTRFKNDEGQPRVYTTGKRLKDRLFRGEHRVVAREYRTEAARALYMRGDTREKAGTTFARRRILISRRIPRKTTQEIRASPTR